MLVSRPDGSLAEVPPAKCSGCDQTRLRPGWGECPDGQCREMGRTYECDAGHVTMASWHSHRIVPGERARWHCRAEDQSSPPPSSSSKNPD